MLRSAYVAQATKPADEAKPRPVRKKTNTRRRAAGKAGLAACTTRFGEWPDKKASSHMDVSRALISAANRVPGKYDFAERETAAPIGACLMIESTQRPFGVFCGNWFVGLGKTRHREIIRK
jgi:hypothetical protein